jgi:hypothetical protein
MTKKDLSVEIRHMILFCWLFAFSVRSIVETDCAPRILISGHTTSIVMVLKSVQPHYAPYTPENVKDKNNYVPLNQNMKLDTLCYTKHASLSAFTNLV